MRLDKYLKVSRLIKRRTVAAEACTAGKIWVNGHPVKASYEVKIGDMIEIRLGTVFTKVKVIKISESAAKDKASELYDLY